MKTTNIPNTTDPMNVTKPTNEPGNQLMLLNSVLLFLFDLAAAGMVIYRHDPVAITAWMDGLPAWARVGVFAAVFVYLARTLDLFGRVCAGVAVRIRKSGGNLQRRSAWFRFASLAVLVGGLAIWKGLDPERFPQAPAWWVYPYLLGAALVPVAVALRAVCRARRTVPAGGGR